MAELMESYIWKINGVNHVRDGVYVARTVTYEDAESLSDYWQKKYKGSRTLICMALEENLEYVERFDFSVVMRLLPAGFKVTRMSWENYYLEMKKDGIYCYLKGTDSLEESIGGLWQPQMADLMATDWQVLRRQSTPEYMDDGA